MTNIINQLQQILFQVWSLQSSSKWTPENPAQGQCGVTALVVQDVLGGEIYKTILLVGGIFIISSKVNAMISQHLNLKN